MCSLWYRRHSWLPRAPCLSISRGPILWVCDQSGRVSWTSKDIGLWAAPTGLGSQAETTLSSYLSMGVRAQNALL